MKTQSFVDVKYQVSQSHSIGYCRCIIVIILVFYFVNIAKLRNMLPVSDAEKLVHAFMTSRLDYCNALLGGCPASSINKLQIVQNAAARVLTKSRKYDHITPILQSLHWLPIKFRISYKILLLAYKGPKWFSSCVPN